MVVRVINIVAIKLKGMMKGCMFIPILKQNSKKNLHAVVCKSDQVPLLFFLTQFDSRCLEILNNKEICHLQLKKRRFIRLSSKFYYKSGQ